MSLFHTIVGFIKSLLGEIVDIERFVQLKPGTYKSYKPNNITGIDKVDSKCNCVNGSVVNGIRETVLYSFGLSPPPGYKIYNQPGVTIFLKK